MLSVGELGLTYFKNMTPEEVKQKTLDDLIVFGEAVTKTEMVEGKPTIRYVNPVSDEFRVAKYNAEHSDSAMEIHYLPAVPQAYDGSKLNRFYVGFDSFDIMPTIRGKTSIYDRMIGIIKFRLPRKLKKKIKKYLGIGYNLKRRELRVFYDAFKLAKYYRCAFKQENNK